MIIKRLFDLIVSLIVFTIFLPFALLIMLILKYTGEGEIFYLQERIGIKGKSFYLIKFATMLKNSPNIGSGDITVKNDPRVLPFGHFLRKTKLNEVPQILNIIKGDMSLVGPRPLTPRNFSFYRENEQEIIKELKPGLTGIGSIVFRDEETIINNSDLSPEQCYKEIIAPCKAQLESWYSSHRSFWLDIQLCFITAWVVFKSESRIYKKVLKDLPELNI